MIVIEINGSILELPQGVSVSFKKKNLLFAFDDAEYEYSSSFEIPATPKNESILSVASWMHGTGAGMRVIYDARLSVGMVSKVGSLYISKYSGGSYSATFVCGQYYSLKRLSDAGSVLSVLDLNDVRLRVGTPAYELRYSEDITSASPLFLRVKYQHTGDIRPAYALGRLLQECADMLGVAVTFPSDWWRYYVIIGEEKALPSSACTMRSVGNGSTYIEDGEKITIKNDLDAEDMLDVVEVVTQRVPFEQYIGTHGAWFYYDVREFRALEDLKLTFPDSIGADWFLASLDNDVTLSGVEFYGGYSFNVNRVASGTPLAGRCIDIAKGSKFGLVNKNWYAYSPTSQTRGFNFFNNSPVYEYACSIQSESHDILRLSDNLTEWNVLDVIKQLAALSGLSLDVLGNRLVFVDMDNADNWHTLSIDGSVLKQTELTRTLGDFAQKSAIGLKDKHAEYVIDNATLAETTTLAELPFSSGVDLLTSADAFVNSEEDVLVRVGAGTYENADAVTITKNATIERLCARSTCIRVQVRMSAETWESMSSDIMVSYNGLQWVWLDSSWTNGVADIFLALFS